MAGCSFISEWPPPSEEHDFVCSPIKRRKTSDIPPLVYSSPHSKIDVILAKWWKQNKKELEPSIVKSSINPNVIKDGCLGLIRFILPRLPEARKFIRERISYLQTLPQSYQICFSLATCYQLIGKDLEIVANALKYAYQAKLLRKKDRSDGTFSIEEDEDESELNWLIELLERQEFMEKKKKQGVCNLQENGLLSVVPPFSQVDKRSCLELTHEEFSEHYLETQTPVIITDLVHKMTSVCWNLEHVKKVIGDKIAPLKRLVPDSVEWARLEGAGECRISSFIDSILSPGCNQHHYLFDWSLPLHCPELMGELTIPEYVCDDLLQRTPPGSLYRKSWPSLFIAPPNIVSDLHVDAFASNFWMALFEGKKRWVFFPPEDMPYLYPVYHHSTDAVFEVDLSDWSKAVTSHPLLALTHPKECILEAGEFLFVPSGCPHRVENKEPSLAISANFVNASNYHKVLEELKVNSLVDPQANELFHALEKNRMPQTVMQDQRGCPKL